MNRVRARLVAVAAAAAAGVLAVGTAAPANAAPRSADPRNRVPVKAVPAPKWRNVPMPALGGLAVPTKVTAAGPRAAWVAGYEKATTKQTPFMLAWNGQRWRRQPLPVPRTTNFQGIAAAGPRNAWALAETYSDNDTSETRPVALHWDGLKWRKAGYPSGVRPRMPYPLPSDADIISAAPGGPAWSLGYDSRARKAVALRFQGDRWVRQNVPVPMVSASAIAVRSAKDIWIACTCEIPQWGSIPAMLHWDGKLWRTVRIPQRNLAYIAHIVPVSAKSVWAYRVGTEGLSAHELMHWDGVLWRSTWIPSRAYLGHLPTLADDGDRGAWVAVTTAERGAANYLHYSAGNWTTESGQGSRDTSRWIYGLARVPGTRSIWAVGLANPLIGPPFIERRS